MNETAEWECIHTVGGADGPGVGRAVTRYGRTALRIMAGDATVYRELATRGMLPRIGIIHLSILGLLYGFAGAVLSGAVLASAQPGGIAFSPLAVAVVGVLVVFLIHGAAALFFWVFCRGLGGHAGLAPYYLSTAAAAMVLWPAAPAMACIQVGLGGVPLMAATAFVAAWGAAVAMTAIRAASGLSAAKMVVAVLATALYVGCFLYLWM